MWPRFSSVRRLIQMGFFALALSPFFSHAETFRPYGLTLDLEGQGAFGASSRLGFAPGAGAAFFADWRPVQLLSLGTGFTVNDYFAPFPLSLRQKRRMVPARNPGDEPGNRNL
jgi:hypothetical protein